MTDCRTMLATLRRPRLLMRAARFGLAEYRRDRDLRRHVGLTASPEDTVTSLMSVEARLEATRLAGDAAYSVARHIEVLIAQLAALRPGTPNPLSGAMRVRVLPGDPALAALPWQSVAFAGVRLSNWTFVCTRVDPPTTPVVLRLPFRFGVVTLTEAPPR